MSLVVTIATIIPVVIIISMWDLGMHLAVH